MALLPTPVPAAVPMFASSPIYQMACQQLRDVAAVMDTPANIIERLSIPKRALIVNVPIRMDNGGNSLLHRLSRATYADHWGFQGWFTVRPAC